jgi:SAM-dependent methyltransferase
VSVEDGSFWDKRYNAEGPIWGWDPSPTALAITPFLTPRARVLDVGFGYGRDVAYYLREGRRASGIDMSTAGRRLALELLNAQGLRPEHLWTERFEEAALPPHYFDAVCCHRVVHLMLDQEAINQFAARVAEVLRPGGLLCVTARNSRDCDPAAMLDLGGNVYEYRHRPGHRIRYWDGPTFTAAFGSAFTFLDLSEEVELESRHKPVPCHLTVLVGKRHEAASLPRLAASLGELPDHEPQPC